MPAFQIIDVLDGQIGLSVCDLPFEAAINIAVTLKWTRDPFDRLISAHAMCKQIPLLTKDKTVRRRLKLAVW